MFIEVVRRGSVRRSPAAFTCTAALLALTSGCGTGAPNVGQSRAGIVYGGDDRKEVSDVEDAAVRTAVTASVAALIPRNLVVARGDQLVVSAPPYGMVANLCEGEPFADEPAAALCSAVLIAPDLVVTAGHCVHAIPLDGLVVVFGYYYAPGGALALDAQDAIEPAHVVVEALDPLGATPRLDFAVIRLSRPAPLARAPAAMSRAVLLDGDPLTFAGTGGGVPLKVDEGATVQDARASSSDFFLADTDTSGGASGGAAFDSALALAGVLARGGRDLQATSLGCLTTVYEEPEKAEEQFTYASGVLDALCADPEGKASSLCRSDCGNPCRALPVPVSAEGGNCTLARSGPDNVYTLAWRGLLIVVVALRRATRRFRC
jgi:hypothetical protein